MFASSQVKCLTIWLYFLIGGNSRNRTCLCLYPQIYCTIRNWCESCLKDWGSADGNSPHSTLALKLEQGRLKDWYSAVGNSTALHPAFTLAPAAMELDLPPSARLAFHPLLPGLIAPRALGLDRTMDGTRSESNRQHCSTVPGTADPPFCSPAQPEPEIGSHGGIPTRPPRGGVSACPALTEATFQAMRIKLAAENGIAPFVPVPG